MVYRPPYPWYFDLPAYLLIRNGGSKYHGGSIYHTAGGGAVFNKGVQYTMDENWPRGQFTMGSKYHMTPGSAKVDSTHLFSITFLYYFISFFPLFNLLVYMNIIFIQSYVNSNYTYPRLDKNVGFWLIDDPLVENPCYRLVVT